MSSASWRWSRCGQGREPRRGAAPGRGVPRPPVDTTTESFVFELTGAPEKIDTFVALMGELGLVETARTGVVGMTRGKSRPA
jgi:hypothetical protein